MTESKLGLSILTPSIIRFYKSKIKVMNAITMQTEDSLNMEAQKIRLLVNQQLELQKDMVCGISTKLLDFKLNDSDKQDQAGPQIKGAQDHEDDD